MFLSWNDASDGSGNAIDPLSITAESITSSMDLYAVYRDRSSTITFHAISGTGPEHEGEFENGNTVNTMTYKIQPVPLEGKAMSPNVVDANTATGQFYRSSETSKTVTLAGASKLQIDVTYRFGSSGTRVFSIFQGTSSTSSSSTNRLHSGYSTTKTTRTYIADGDTVQF